MFWLRKLSRLGLGAATVVVAFSVTGSQAETAAHEDVEATIRNVVEASNAGDVEAYIASFTDEGILQGGLRRGPGFGSREEATTAVQAFLGIVQLEIAVLFVTETTATADMSLRYQDLIERSLRELRFVDGEWLLHTSRIISAEIPSGVTPVPLKIAECEFTFDRSLATEGNIAFRALTSGSSSQQIILARLGTDTPLTALLESAGPPPGVEQLFFSIIEPNRLINLVLAQPLTPGRYALICFVPVPGGPPLVRGGSEFIVGTPIRPPSTGSAGLIIDRQW